MLVLNRNPDGQFDLLLHGVVLSRYRGFPEALDRAGHQAKAHRKDLYLTEACVADWVVGFRTDAVPLLARLENVSEESVQAWAQKNSCRFVEGPFGTRASADDAAFRISGQKPIES